MSNFVNKIKTKDGQEYEVHDSRMPEVPAGGTKLYLHTITFNNGTEYVIKLVSNTNILPTVTQK